MTRVLVTGASGFVGAALVPALLRRGHVVRAAARQPSLIAPREGLEVAAHPDLENDIDWAPHLEGVDLVVHLAGIAHSIGVSDERFERVNRVATRRLAEAARTQGVGRFVYVSSIKAQTGSASEAVLTERDEPRPEDGYGRSKLAAERDVASAGIPFTVLRPVLVYGPGVKGNLKSLRRLADSPWPLPLGGLRNRRSLLAVENLVAAIELSFGADATLDQTFVVADPSPVTVGDIVSALRDGFGRPRRLVDLPQSFIEMPLRAAGRAAIWQRIGGSLVVDPAKLLAAGWVPQVETRAGLAALSRPS